MSDWVIVVELQVSNSSAISWREQAMFWWDDDYVHFVLDQQAEFDFYIVLVHWNNSPLVESDTLSWFLANHSLLFLLNAA